MTLIEQAAQPFAALRRGLVAAALGLGLTTSVSAGDGPLVEADWLADNLDRADLIVLDTRGISEDGDPYAEGHIPGAVHAPYPGGWRTTVDGVPGQLPPISDLEAHIGGLGLSGEETVVIVPAASDASEFGAATRVYWTLRLVGLDDVAILNGGYRAWEAADGPLDIGRTEPIPVRFSAELRPELLIESEEVSARLGDGSTVMLDGRPEAQFTGQDKSPLARLAGRLPGATHLDHSAFFEPDTGRLLPEEAAAELIPANVADPDVEIVSYCNTGHWASINWFVLSEVLGYEQVTLFDDSMVGWTENPDNPVESDRTRLDELMDWMRGDSG